MKTVIVYNHPYEKSFNHAILEATMRGLKHSENEIDLINLDEDKFNPVMEKEDLLGFVRHSAVDDQAVDYINRLQNADNLVFIFPIWWELMPAMMKGFIDKVIFPGGTFDYTKSGYGMISKLSRLKKTTVITTMNTPKALYRMIFSNAIQRSLIRGTLKKSGMKNITWLSFNMIKSSSIKRRTSWLVKVEKHFKNI
ncbi:NAD(P)H-dependent oxidoreductase [Weissella diestrammenae]|uniref:NAD(P)H-dependent oxidoreductase n=1 Tax=Weissella diestrammenae TaxID=1162633 RepID=A0A7G9T589_9LACO|nr:NAD(P)H-dependent oxidoreductase [Weissella diestrammenae]MCM0583119.1 NAD(P)H-dependent oxidoreductase [Weissella diestrammenae]QNN75264.1 NAD(P)H-dependent oxidoreductase [Weissella diestrammenae]